MKAAFSQISFLVLLLACGSQKTSSSHVMSEVDNSVLKADLVCYPDGMEHKLATIAIKDDKAYLFNTLIDDQLQLFASSKVKKDGSIYKVKDLDYTLDAKDRTVTYENGHKYDVDCVKSEKIYYRDNTLGD